MGEGTTISKNSKRVVALIFPREENIYWVFRIAKRD